MVDVESDIFLFQILEIGLDKCSKLIKKVSGWFGICGVWLDKLSELEGCNAGLESGSAGYRWAPALSALGREGGNS